MALYNHPISSISSELNPLLIIRIKLFFAKLVVATERAKKIFGDYRPNWSHEQFAEAEILCSGIEFATLMTVGDTVALETRISGALNQILGIYGIEEQMWQEKLRKVFLMDHKALGMRVLREFKEYVEQANEQAFYDLLKR